MRVMLVDDHALVRSGLRMLVEAIADAEVVGEAANGLEALGKMAALRPDCVLMDLSMPGINGFEVIRRATAQFPAIPIIVLSMHADAGYVREALAAGAKGYLLKGADRKELEAALRAVENGHPYLSPAVSETVLAALSQNEPADAARQSPLSALTDRQVEVLRLLSEGNSNKQIAAALSVSPKTIEAHRAAIMAKLGLRDLASLVRLAVKEGLVS